MANLYSNGIDQAIDSNGNVYPGARRHFYNNKTPTHRTIWQDAEKQNPHDNPVVADASGVFPDVWIEGVYSTRLEDQSGALIPHFSATQDNVNSTITDILSAQAGSAITLSNVDYDQANSSGLNFAYSSGRVDNWDGSITAISAGVLPLAANQTTLYIYYDYSQNAVVSSTSSSRNLSKLLFTASTDASTITSVTSEKDAFQQILYPVGEIKIYPLASIPPGVRATPLDGLPRDAVANPEFSNLYSYLGNAFGGTDNTDFIVPTYAGYVMRIWNNGAGIDPDAATRGDRGDGTTGDQPGTVQSFALQNITGAFQAGKPGGASGAFIATPGVLASDGSQASGFTYGFDASRVAQTSTETRMANKYVYAVMTY